MPADRQAIVTGPWPHSRVDAVPRTLNSPRAHVASVPKPARAAIRCDDHYTVRLRESSG